MKKQFVLIVLAVFLFVGCQGQTEKSEVVKTLAPKEFAAKYQATADAQLIDVRTPKEFAEERIDGFTNIDWNGSDFEAQAAKLDKSKPVFVHCRSGARSAKAASKLQDMGFTEVYDMEGGILKWNSEGLPKAQK